MKEIITDGSVLRITVDGGGCSGFIYKFDLDRNISEDDRVFGRNGVEIIIDPVSFSYIKGSVVDYEEQLIKSSFKIVNNPIADDGCSCGSSFSVKMWSTLLSMFLEKERRRK